MRKLLSSVLAGLLLISTFAAPIRAQELTFSRENISRQGIWVLTLAEFATALATNITALQPNRIELINLIRDNADRLNDIGQEMVDNTSSLSTAESVANMGEALKLFAGSVDLGLATQPRGNDGSKSALSAMTSVNATLLSIADNLIDLGAEAQAQGGSLNIRGYADQMENAVFAFTAFEKIRIGVDKGETVQAKIVSNQSTKNLNTTHQVITFDATDSTDSAGTIDSTEGYFWDFGDGTFAHGPFVSHMYTEPNNYLVKLMVIGLSGFDVTTKTIKIEPVYPVAIITTDRESIVGPHLDTLEVVVEEPVTFSAVSSFDPNGSRDKLEFSWDFGDGTTDTSSREIVHHSFMSPGEYAVILTADNGTLSDSDVKKVTVLPALPKSFIKLRPSNIEEWQPNEKDFWTEVFVEPVTIELSAEDSLGAPINNDTERSQIENFEWEFGDGSRLKQLPSDVRSGNRISHTFETTGTYILTLTISDERGLESTATKFIHLTPPEVPSADFSASPWKTLSTEDTLRLNALSSFAPQGNITTYVWEILDNSEQVVASSSQPKMQHVFSLPGTYDVTMTVANSLGNDSPRVSQQVVVQTDSPIADFEFTHDSQKQNLVLFDASTSYDPDPDDILLYSWDFDNDGTFEIQRDTKPQVQRVLDTIGTNEVLLEVTDSFNARDTVVKEIEIDSALVAEIIPLSDDTDIEDTERMVVTGITPLNLSLTGKGYHNFSTGTDSNEVNYYEWDFGDDSPKTIKSNVIDGIDSVRHLYTIPGDYVLTLTVRDRNNKSQVSELPIHVGDGINPLAVITTERQPVNTNSTNTVFIFDGGLSVNARGVRSSLSYSWDFGDGSPIERGATAQHTFSETGSYTVTLSTLDETNKRIDKSTLIVTITDQPVVVRYNVSATEGAHPLRITFDAADTYDPDGPILEYRWDFGDGEIVRSPRNPEATHIYKEAGTYTATLEVTDEHRMKVAGNPVIISVE